MTRLVIVVLFVLFCQSSVDAQLLGTPKIFDYIHTPTSARANALSNSVIAIQDDDILQAFNNPALLNIKQNKEVGLSHSFVFAGIQNGAVNFGMYVDSLDVSVHGGVQYIDYGTFELTDQFGNINGDFGASEVAIVIGASKQVAERITLGVNTRFMTASYETYGASALGIDAGVLYSNPDNTFAIGAVLKNVGVTLSHFAGIKEKPRHDIQIGITKRLEHLPFRINVTLHQLQQWNLTFDDPNDVQTDFLGNLEEESDLAIRLHNIMSHILLGGEFMFGSSGQFRLRVGYNHLRNRQLSVGTFRNLTGFSFGVGFNIKRFKLDYGVAHYHSQGASNQISIRFNPFTYHKV